MSTLFVHRAGIPMTIGDPGMIRATANDPRFVSEELHRVEATPEHLFRPGDKATLTGLVSFPEFNGTEVEITAIRESGEYGRAYYFRGAANSLLNWTFEDRLQKIESPAIDFQI